jgi:2,3-bisphosphoglycerate-independent phosphoglycerate mutase
MKYCIVILDGAAGWPLPGRGNRTSLELAETPNLDSMTREGQLGLARTIPPGMEPSSANACMSILGYDPQKHYRGRAAIEARNMGIAIHDGEAVFRANLVAVGDGRMQDYSAGHITTGEAKLLITALNEDVGDEFVKYYPGLSYRHICKLQGQEDSLMASCTPPHDIPGQPINDFLPRGTGSEILRHLMLRSESVLGEHPVNIARRARGDLAAGMVWLFWSSGRVADMPQFRELYGHNAAVTSAVDVIGGLARMMGMDVLDIPGVKDGLDNDFSAQAAGALEAFNQYDLVVIHIEATDEAAHAGKINDKVAAIEKVDSEVISQIREPGLGSLRVLLMPDHPTPIATRTHAPDPVPFLLWGAGVSGNGARWFTESEARATGLCIEDGWKTMGRLVAE